MFIADDSVTRPPDVVYHRPASTMWVTLVTSCTRDYGAREVNITSPLGSSFGQVIKPLWDSDL